MLVDGEAAELNWLCFDLSAGRFTGICFLLILMVIFAFIWTLGTVFGLVPVSYLVHIGSGEELGVVRNWLSRVFLR